MDGVWFKLGWHLVIKNWTFFWKSRLFGRREEGDAGVELFGGSCRF